MARFLLLFETYRRFPHLCGFSSVMAKAKALEASSFFINEGAPFTEVQSVGWNADLSLEYFLKHGLHRYSNQLDGNDMNEVFADLLVHLLQKIPRDTGAHSRYTHVEASCSPGSKIADARRHEVHYRHRFISKY